MHIPGKIQDLSRGLIAHKQTVGMNQAEFLRILLSR
jgi:hypothetical protein